MITTQRNERRCDAMEEAHILPITPACPVSGNPQSGSSITITYSPSDRILEVESLRSYVDSYTGGLGDIRSMEGMMQAITQDAADALGVSVEVIADLNIRPNQKMRLRCSTEPKP
jgi:NADPH-dependent 7-cyano-7-deazaguanine reductase QueF